MAARLEPRAAGQLACSDIRYRGIRARVAHALRLPLGRLQPLEAVRDAEECSFLHCAQDDAGQPA
eukprot:6266262-Prymnesium_polylepis.1